jgi:hypothetical protein
MTDDSATTCELCGGAVHGAAVHPCCDWWIRQQGHDNCVACTQSRRDGDGIQRPIRIPEHDREHDPHSAPEAPGPKGAHQSGLRQRDPQPPGWDPTAAYRRGIDAAERLRQMAVQELPELIAAGDLTEPELARLNAQLSRLRECAARDEPHDPDSEEASVPRNDTDIRSRSAFVAPGRQLVLDAALAYADTGLRVIPIRPGRKHPPMDDWPRAATTDPAVIRSWWNGAYRRCGVGIATGAGSGVWVLDVDVADGKPGATSLAELEASYGRLPDTVEAITGTGGRHLYFTWDSLHPVRNDQSGRAGQGLDVRGEGGQVLAAPTIHPVTGDAYHWRVGHGPNETAFARAPEWLYAVLECLPDPPKPPAPASWIRASRSWPPSSEGESPAAAFDASTTWPATAGPSSELSAQANNAGPDPASTREKERQRPSATPGETSSRSSPHPSPSSTPVVRTHASATKPRCAGAATVPASPEHCAATWTIDRRQ